MPGSSFGLENGGSITTRSDDDERLGRLHQPVAGLQVEGRVVGEPDHHRAGVGLDVELGAAVEQRLDRGRRHHGLAGAGGRGQRERRDLVVAVEGDLGAVEVVEDLLDGVALVGLERELHSVLRPDSISKLRRYAS